MRFSIIKRSYLWLLIGLALATLSATVFFLNFNLSIEFTGGVEMSIATQTSEADIQETLETSLQNQGFDAARVSANKQVDGNTSVVVNVSLADDAQVKEVSNQLQQAMLSNQIITSESDILGLSLIGPSIGGNMKNTTLVILIAGLIAVAVYMMFSFAGIRDFVSPLTLAVVTIVTMLFDLIITSGAYGLYMLFDPTIQVNTVFVTAMLMIMGYSINDTIIIMDRIRENVTKRKDNIGKGMLYGQVFEDSIWQTMRRSIGTSLSTFLVVFVLFIFSFMYNATLIQYFAFVLSVGVIAGTYSSIFIAAPLVYLLLGKFKKEHKRLK